MRSSPSSCFIKQTAAVIAGTGTPNLLMAEYSQALSTHIPTFSDTDGSWSQPSIHLTKNLPSQKVSLNLLLYIRPIYTINSIWRLSFPFELLGVLANNQAEFSGKQQKSHKLSWILHLEENHQVSGEERMGQRKRKMPCDSCLLCIPRNAEVMGLCMWHCPQPGKHQGFCKFPEAGGKGKAPGGAGYKQPGQSCSLNEGSIS